MGRVVDKPKIEDAGLPLPGTRIFYSQAPGKTVHNPVSENSKAKEVDVFTGVWAFHPTRSLL